MAAKRIWMTVALALVLMSTGCQSWCNKHYPCQTACQPCTPCCPQPAAYAPAPVAAWNAPPPPAAVPARPLTCTCVPQ